VPVPGVVEARFSATFDDHDGRPVFIRGRESGGRLGTCIRSDHWIAREHGDLFMPLIIAIEFGA
jgi:hypothetical protein